MITKELVVKALETSHTGNCRGESGCIHADGFAESYKEVMAYLLDLMMNPTQQNNLPLAILFAGAHVGYRLHQLELEPANPKGVN